MKNRKSEPELTPEMALLIACVRPHCANFQSEVLSDLYTNSIDWDVVISSAQYHKVIPLLQKTLTTSHKYEIPSDVLARIASLDRSNSLRALTVSASLINVIKLLKKNGIDVLPVKGPILAEKLYGSIAMRSFGDVDILVHRHNIEKTLTILLENDYTLHPQGIRRSTFTKFLQHYQHGRLIDKNGVLIELHWELSGFYASAPMTLKSLRPYLANSTFKQCPVLDLTDEMNFIFLCLHGNKHCFTLLDYVCTIARLVRNSPDLDWNIIFELGEKHRMRKRILVSLALINKFFGIAVPTPISYTLSHDSSPARLADTLIAQEFCRTADVAKVHPLNKLIRYQAQALDRKRDSILFILRSLIIPEHDIWHTPHLPDVLFPLYFLYKPYRAATMPIRNLF